MVKCIALLLLLACGCAESEIGDLDIERCNGTVIEVWDGAE